MWTLCLVYDSIPGAGTQWAPKMCEVLHKYWLLALAIPLPW